MQNKTPLTIVKIGGNVLDDAQALQNFLQDFSMLEGLKIMVHGGGKAATKTAENLGLKPLFSNGRRITDKAMLEVAVMTYAGLINQSVTAALQAMQCNAIGCSGAGGNLITAVKRKVETIDFGFVGDISTVNATAIEQLLHIGLVPVFSAITHDGHGQLLNTNADTIAAELAVALSGNFKVRLVYCFEKNGVLQNADDNNSYISELDYTTYEKLKNNGQIHSGMLPKLDNCFHALQQGVAAISIGNPEVLKSGNTVYTKIMHQPA